MFGHGQVKQRIAWTVVLMTVLMGFIIAISGAQTETHWVNPYCFRRNGAMNLSEHWHGQKRSGRRNRCDLSNPEHYDLVSKKACYFLIFSKDPVTGARLPKMVVDWLPEGYYAGEIIHNTGLGRDAIVGLHVVEGPFLEQYLMWTLIFAYRYDNKTQLGMAMVNADTGEVVPGFSSKVLGI